MAHKFIVKGQELRKYSKETIVVSDSIDFVRLEFEFSQDWEGFTRIARLEQGETKLNVQLDSVNSIAFPAELIAGDFELSVFGYDSEGAARRGTSLPLKLTILASGYDDAGTPPVPPTPDLYSQMLGQFTDLHDRTLAAYNRVTGIELEVDVVSGKLNLYSSGLDSPIDISRTGQKLEVWKI